ncbi:MAG: hypothetical protein Q9Q40_10485 [Acidobacteriota bacterium]|nr:hypothetical protein [Acidobacteriota bacterium]
MRPAHRWRRRLAGWWLRWKRWEFWPPWALYPPIVAWILWLTLRHGGLSVFTSVNTKLWSAGVIGGSKIRILAALSSCDERVARSWLLAPDPDLDRRTERLLEATARLGLDWPVVLKPDSGARGRGVGIVHDGAEARAHLAAEPGPLVLQEYVPGREYGVFYTRMPGEARGRIFSITDKRPAEVVGDGRRCLEELIYDDPRAVALARVYCEGLAGRLAEVPAAGERVRLGELGTHCRGAIFLDGNHLRTPALEDAVDRLASAVEGFHFGRFDLRAPSEQAFRRGRFKVVELNGLVSEAAHVYDPSFSLLAAYRVFFRQWSLAARIGARQRRRGHRGAGFGQVLRAALDHRRRRSSGR